MNSLPDQIGTSFEVPDKSSDTPQVCVGVCGDSIRPNEIRDWTVDVLGHP